MSRLEKVWIILLICKNNWTVNNITIFDDQTCEQLIEDAFLIYPRICIFRLRSIFFVHHFGGIKIPLKALTVFAICYSPFYTLNLPVILIIYCVFHIPLYMMFSFTETVYMRNFDVRVKHSIIHFLVSPHF